MTIKRVQDRAVGYLVSILPELCVVDFSKLVTREMTIAVRCLSAAVGIGRGTAGLGWVFAAVNNCKGSACVKKKI